MDGVTTRVIFFQSDIQDWPSRNVGLPIFSIEYYPCETALMMGTFMTHFCGTSDVDFSPNHDHQIIVMRGGRVKHGSCIPKQADIVGCSLHSNLQGKSWQRIIRTYGTKLPFGYGQPNRASLRPRLFATTWRVLSGKSLGNTGAIDLFKLSKFMDG